MPNWCMTNMNIYCDDKDKLKEFNNLLDEWTSRDYMKNGFGHCWLGNIVLGSGVGTIDSNKETDLRCSGTMCYKDLHEDQLTIETETAWSPMMTMWFKLIEKYIPDARLFYTAEESGCGIFYTNDPDYVGKYIIDSWNDEVESNWEADKKEIVEVLQFLLKTEETNVKKLINMLHESDIDDVSINQWEYVNEYDLS